jgi:hypothetical protein
LDEFWKNAKLISAKEIRSVNYEKNSENYNCIVNRIVKEDNPELISKYMRLLESNPSLVMVPSLFSLIEDKRILHSGFMHFHDRQMSGHYIAYDVTVSDRVVSIIEYIYYHSFPLPPEPGMDKEFISGFFYSAAHLRNKKSTSKQWIKYWKENGKDYQNWGKKFFKEKINLMKKQSSVGIGLINELFASKFYKSEHKEMLLQSLSNVSPPEDINHLKIREGLLDAGDLKYFLDLSISPDEWEKFLKFCKDIDGKKAFPFLKKISQNYSDFEKGVLYNGFIFYDPFKKWLKNDDPDPELLDDIIQGLEKVKNLDRYPFYEDEIVELISFVKRLKLPISEQLERILEEGASSKSIGQVMKDSSFDELATIFSFYTKLPALRHIKVEFVAEDLGLCVPGLTEENVDQKALELAKNLKRFSEYELYKYYVGKWRLNVFDRNGRLNFRNIFTILKFDSARMYSSSFKSLSPFMSVIRLLELHFKTRLGFEERFNNSVNGYLFNTCKRAKTWMEYLVKNGHCIDPENEASSF